MLFEAKNIQKSFGPKKVLNGINFAIGPGEVHGLVGKNGAGKSTLVNIIAGVLKPDDGEVIFDGEKINHLTVLKRQKQGIFIVPQHAAVIPEFSVAENLFLGTWPKKGNLVDWKDIHKTAKEELNKYGLMLDPAVATKTLSLVEQRKLNIVRALFSKAKLIVLDEPTTALSVEDRKELFDFVNELKKKGTSFIFISHYSEEILSLSDHLTVLRDGESFTGYKKDTIKEDQLATLITGASVDLINRPAMKAVIGKENILECSGISGKNIKGVNFHLKKGEILGFIGFPESGSREVARGLVGLHKLDQGIMKLDNQQASWPSSPKSAFEKGIVYVSHDRHKEGIVGLLSIKENISLSILKTFLKTKAGVINEKLETDNANEYFQKLNIKAHSISEKLNKLSGGNQQKVVLSRALSRNPKILIVDEPTVGIDVKSREEILFLLNDLTQLGLSVIYLTNDYNELLRIADRLLFFKEGVVINEVKNTNLTIEDVVNIRDGIRKEELMYANK